MNFHLQFGLSFHLQFVYGLSSSICVWAFVCELSSSIFSMSFHPPLFYKRSSLICHWAFIFNVSMSIHLQFVYVFHLSTNFHLQFGYELSSSKIVYPQCHTTGMKTTAGGTKKPLRRSCRRCHCSSASLLQVQNRFNFQTVANYMILPIIWDPFSPKGS